MKKKIIIGAVALMGVFGGLTAWQSLSGQNEAKARCKGFFRADGICVARTCTAGYGGWRCNISLSHPE